MSVNAASASARIASRETTSTSRPMMRLDAHALGGDFAVGGGVLAEREQRRVLVGREWVGVRGAFMELAYQVDLAQRVFAPDGFQVQASLVAAFLFALCGHRIFQSYSYRDREKVFQAGQTIADRIVQTLNFLSANSGVQSPRIQLRRSDGPLWGPAKSSCRRWHSANRDICRLPLFPSPPTIALRLHRLVAPAHRYAQAFEALQHNDKQEPFSGRGLGQ